MTKSENGRRRERQDAHWIEWLTGIVSALLVAALFGWLGWEALMRPTTPPDLSIHVVSTEPSSGGYRLAFDISNAGTTTAAAVTVIGRLIKDGQVIEESPIVFDYVAAQSRTQGAIFFRNDPAASEMVIRPAGYTSP
ncbi:TIGR02588 family protein [Shinella sedimenti]|uniref:TIGR02588 family protein n=1 Tax=Shinella sedimenti TaxID=2919913 RepID=A0ABT0CJ17_9HYPH|nr:TIGR02588 family protein [Shinella sedimenti]MCJ8148602.1 TIGR02588 family protein [Shinella sedimenti]